MSIGLRYEVEQNPRELRRQGSNFDLKLGRPVTMDELKRDFIQFTDRVNFAPRIGFAWRRFGSKRLALRSHYGMFYVPLTGAPPPRSRDSRWTSGSDCRATG